MKLFLRALLVGGLFTAASLAFAADTPAPPIAPKDKAPAATTTPAPAAKPATTTPATPTTIASTGCDNCSAGKVLGGRLGGRFGSRAGVARAGAYGGRFDSSRADQLAEGYLAFGERLGQCFQKLAGPPVDVAATPHGGGGHKGGPHTQPGTVVFPQHPFIRSPRDFFMTEQP